MSATGNEVVKLSQLKGTTDAIKSSINNVLQVAQGKTKTYVLANQSAITGTKASDGSYTNVTAITGITLSDLAIGDIILIIDTEVPDLWVSQLTPSVTLSKLETTKVDLTGYVQTTRKVNNKALSSDITLNASDVNALPSNTSYVSSVNGSSGAITNIATTSDIPTSVDGMTGGVISSTTTVNGTMTATTLQATNGLTVLNGAFSISDSTNIGMEIGKQNGTAGQFTPYFDFHTGATNDYDARLIVSGGTAGTNAQGNVTFNCANLTAPKFTKSGGTSSQFLKADGSVDSTSYANSRTSLSMIPYGTPVPAQADLNTLTYISVGNYYCSQNATASTQTNCPTSIAYMMVVYSPLSTTIDNETTSTWVYRTRVITDLYGNEWFQLVNSGATAGTFTYGAWKKKINSSAFSLNGTTLTITI